MFFLLTENRFKNIIILIRRRYFFFHVMFEFSLFQSVIDALAFLIFNVQFE